MSSAGVTQNELHYSQREFKSLELPRLAAAENLSDNLYFKWS